MRFYVIYSYDGTKDINPPHFDPPNVLAWTQTEDDDGYEFNYLAVEMKNDNFRNGVHRKYTREMDKNEFKQFVDIVGLTYEDVDTMGSISDMGWLPAMSFRREDGMSLSDSSGLIDAGAYVTPIPEPVRDYHKRPNWQELPEEFWAQKEDKHWNWLKSAMKEMFG